MTTEIKIQEFATLLRERRGTRGLRAVAKEIGEVSASTLSRIEQGKLPDLDTFIRICRWLDVPPDEFMVGYDTNTEDTEQVIDRQRIAVAHLRADPILDPKISEALVEMINLAYEAALRGEIAKKED